MSLTSILSYSDKKHKAFRDFLKKSFPLPKFKSNELIKCEPQTRNFMLIGKAYDYLLRFTLENKYEEKVFSSSWVSEKALTHFVVDEKYNVKDEGFQRFYRYNKAVHEKYLRSKKFYNLFIKNEISITNKDLVESTLFLARLDDVYRRGSIMKEYLTLNSEDELDITDLTNLIKDCSLKKFNPEHKLILNPTFGKASNFIGGADADFIVDDLLVDIKVTKDLRLTRPIFNQLVGYYLLHLIGGVDNHKDVEIKRLGVYFARHDVLWSIGVDELGDKELFKEAINVLINCSK